MVLTRQAAEKALPSLLGMALDYSPSLDRHEPQRKVGVITSADLIGREIRVGGFLYGRDFPEIVGEVRRSPRAALLPTPAPPAKPQRAGPRLVASAATRAGLGMSYEIADARVQDMQAPVWKLTEVMFTGAAILRRDRAAYQNTWIELA